MMKQAKIFWLILVIIGFIAVVSFVVSRFFDLGMRTTYEGGEYYGEEVEVSAPMAAGFSTANKSALRSAMEISDAQVPIDDENSSETTERLIIKTGAFSVVVKDVNIAVEVITKYAVEKGGFVVSSNIYKEDIAPYARVTIRVPVDSFDEGMGEIKKLGEVKSESINGQDITEEYIDLEARLRNLQATEGQFLEIMKKAYKIEDILAVQRELTNVRDRIERIEGSMKYLQQSAELSTITVHLSTDPEVLPAVDEQDKWKPWAKVKEATRSLLNLGKALSYVVIWVAIYIPLWLLLGLVGWIVYRLLKRLFRFDKDKFNS